MRGGIPHDVLIGLIFLLGGLALALGRLEVALGPELLAQVAREVHDAAGLGDDEVHELGQRVEFAD